MPMPLEQWDREIAPYLHDIEWSAAGIRRYTALTLAACHALAARPEWEATAEDEIKKTILYLEEALAGLQRAKGVYDGKRVDA